MELSSHHLLNRVPSEFSPAPAQTAEASLLQRCRFLQSLSAFLRQTITPSRLASAVDALVERLQVILLCKAFESHVYRPEIDLLAQIELGEVPLDRQPVSVRLERKNGTQYIVFELSECDVL